jgi:putative Mg2+ transporter-C (MgtC) family protein
VDLTLETQVDLAIRLLIAGILGAAVGLEREIHEHPAGMRTHLLVSAGAAAFTVLSVYAFPAAGADPARIAAQIVTGVGFLGAGSILKEGATIRGLTTAASLWAVAAVGMAAGAGAWSVAVVLTLIAVVSLWPLRVITDRVVGREQHRMRVRVSVADPGRLGALVEAVSGHGGDIAQLSSSPGPTAPGLVAEVEVHLADVAAGGRLTAAIAGLDGVELIEAKSVSD